MRTWIKTHFTWLPTIAEHIRRLRLETRRAAWLLGFLALAACGGAIPLRSRFDPAGELGAMPAPGARTGAREIRVFAQSAPPGFAMEGDTLTVEPGYGHTILGIVTIWRQDIDLCELRSISREDVFQELRKATAAHGGNAVIHAMNLISDKPTNDEKCAAVYGAGWAVILGERAEAAP